jgi:hypothetical protein
MDDQPRLPETLDEEHEARAIAKARSEFAAGKGVPHEKVRVWLQALARGENPPPPAAD